MNDDKAIRAAKLTLGGILEKNRAKQAQERAPGQIAPSKYMPNVPRAVHAAGGYVPAPMMQGTPRLAVAKAPIQAQQPEADFLTSMQSLTDTAKFFKGDKDAPAPAAAPEPHAARAEPHGYGEGISAEAAKAMSGLQGAWSGPEFGIVSGYRDPKKNEEVGGAKGSQHIHGNAFDVDTTGWPEEDKLALADAAWEQGFRGFGFYDNNMHFDVGAERGWGPSFSRDSIPEWAQGWTANRYGYAEGGEIGGDDIAPVADLGQARQQKQIKQFHTGLMGDVKTSMNSMMEAHQKALDAGVFDGYEVGDVLQGSAHPMRITGKFMRKWKPSSMTLQSFDRMGAKPTIIEHEDTQYIPMLRYETGLEGTEGWQSGDVYLDGVKAAGYKKMGGLRSVKADGGPIGDDDGIEAYHGSPHDFDQFDIGKINTGEGAQSYGHGLYFAGNEGTARYYRDTLRPDLPLVHIDGRNTGKRISESDQHVKNMLTNGMTPEQYHSHLLNSPRYASMQKTYADASDVDDGIGITNKDIAKWDIEGFHKKLDEIKGYFGKKVNAFVPEGHMYKVKLNVQPHELLDWDAPLSEQHPKVQEALSRMDPDQWHPSGSDYDPSEMGQISYHRIVSAGNRDGAIGEHLGPNSPPMKRGDKWASEALMENGIKGIRYRDAGSRGDDKDGDPTHNYVMFHHDPVKVKKKYEYGGTVDRSAFAKGGRTITDHGLYSRAAEIIRGLPQEKGTVDQYIAAAKKLGAKPSEIEHAGRPEGDKISREDMAKHFDRNLPKMEAHQYGENPSYLSREQERRLYALGDKKWQSGRGGDPLNEAEEAEHALLTRRTKGPEVKYENPEYNDENEPRPTEYQDYTIPGGSNYRERLLTLPHTDGNNDYVSSHWHENDNILAHIRMSDRTVGGDRNAMRPVMEKLADHMGVGIRDLGAGSAEVGVKNGVISPEEAASVSRLMRWSGSPYYNKPGLDKRVLHVEEMQSDWGQEGKKQGFYDPKNPYEIFDTKTGDVVSKHPSQSEMWDAYRAMPEDQAAGLDYGHARHTSKKKPAAPYVQNTQHWTDLALKNVLHEAAMGNYDHVVFTPGQAQADRYGLDKKVDSISYHPSEKTFTAFRDNRPVVTKNGVETSDVSGLIGGEMAGKLLHPDNAVDLGGGEMFHSLSGDDLRMGGQGMKGYYDNILPKSVMRLAQQHDPDINPGSMPLSDQYTGFSIPMTDKLKQGVLGGQTAFKRGGTVDVEKALGITRSFTKDGKAATMRLKD